MTESRFRNFDALPNVRKAGLSSRATDSAAQCLQPQFDQGPGTPPHLKKYRKSHQNQPGIKQIHPGLFDDRIEFPQSHAFGKKFADSDHVNQIIGPENFKGLSSKFNEIKESKYASNMREPLFKGFERGYNWPETIENKENHPFGVPNVVSDSTKEIVNPTNPLVNPPEVIEMYKKTHGNFAPGEQKNRDYQWPIDKTTHRFGYGERAVVNGAATALHLERSDPQYFPRTIIVKKTVEDVRGTQSDNLGVARNLGTGKVPVGEDFAFGIRNVDSMGDNVWNAARCLHGEPHSRELQPDRDLGRCVKPGSRNQVRRPEDANRAFGCPTIRTDIPFKEFKSVADYQNYGDEPEAVDLLWPSTYQELNVTEFDFQQPKHRQDIKSLFEKIGFSYKAGKFNAIYNRAKELMTQYRGGQVVAVDDDKVSVRAFMSAVKEMHAIE